MPSYALGRFQYTVCIYARFFNTVLMVHISGQIKPACFEKRAENAIMSHADFLDHDLLDLCNPLGEVRTA
jgi:hypothetical protein